MRIQANDNVIVTKGRDRGKRGRVTRVLTKDNKVVIEGINVVTRHQRPSGTFRQGGIIQKELPIPVANLMFFHEDCDGPARVGFRTLADGTKARECKSCGEVIE
jgi:large subunit ribosomal protein L24